MLQIFFCRPISECKGTSPNRMWRFQCLRRYFGAAAKYTEKKPTRIKCWHWFRFLACVVYCGIFNRQNAFWCLSKTKQTQSSCQTNWSGFFCSPKVIEMCLNNYYLFYRNACAAQRKFCVTIKLVGRFPTAIVFGWRKNKMLCLFLNVHIKRMKFAFIVSMLVIYCIFSFKAHRLRNQQSNQRCWHLFICFLSFLSIVNWTGLDWCVLLHFVLEFSTKKTKTNIFRWNTCRYGYKQKQWLAFECHTWQLYAFMHDVHVHVHVPLLLLCAVSSSLHIPLSQFNLMGNWNVVTFCICSFGCESMRARVFCRKECVLVRFYLRLCCWTCVSSRSCLLIHILLWRETESDVRNFVNYFCQLQNDDDWVHRSDLDHFLFLSHTLSLPLSSSQLLW